MRAGSLRLLTVAACGVALVAFGPWTAVRASDEPPEAEGGGDFGRQALVGQWKLNADLSEEPREKMQEAMQKRRDTGRGGGGGGMPGGGMGGGGMGRSGGTGRGGGGGRGGEEGQRPPRPSTPPFFSAEKLTITHIAPAVAIVEPDGLVRTLQPDGEKYQAEHLEGEVKTRWKGNGLVVETRTERGKMKETWTVSPETGQLTVRLELEPGGGRMPKIEIDRVYDPVER